MASDYNKTVTSRNSVNPANFSFNTGNIIGYPNKISSGSRSSSGGTTTNLTLNLDELLTDNLEEGVTSEKIENPKAYEVLDENFTEGDSASYSKSSDFEKAAATVVECGFSFLKGFFKVGENILDGVVQLGSNIVVGVSEGLNYLGADIDTQAIKDSTQAFVSTDYVGLAYEEVVGKNEWIQQNSQASDTALAIFEGAGTITGYALVNAIPGVGGSMVAAFGAAGSAAENAYQCGATYGEASVVAWVAGGTAFAMDAGLDKLGKAAKGATTLKEVGKYTLAGAGMGIVEPTVNYTTQYLTYANDQVDENGNPLYDNYLDYMATSGYLFEAGVGSLIGAGSTGGKAFKSYNINTEITNRAASHGSGNIPLDLGYRTTKKYTIGNPPFEIKTDLTEGEMIKFANDFYNLKPPISSLDEIPSFGVPNRAADIEVSPDGTYGVNWVDEQGFKIGKDGKPIKTEGTIPAGQQMDRYGNPNGRFAGEMEIDSNGNYQGVKYGERSLPYAEGSQAYSKFEVTKDINSQNLSAEINARPEAERIAIIKSMESDGLKNGVDFTVDSNNNVTVHVFEGEIAPAYGYKGGGTQYEFPVRTKILEDLGFIKPIK